jgi:tetratricopeptide (TPR) repeat protein
MGSHRPAGLVAAAFECALCACAGPKTPPTPQPAASQAPASAPSPAPPPAASEQDREAAPPSGAAPPSEAAALAAEIAALRDQQIRLTDELRGVKAALAELSSLHRPAPSAPVSDESRAALVAPPAESPAAEPVGAEPGGADAEKAPAATAPEASPAVPYVDVARRLIEDEDFATAVRVLNVAAELDPGFDQIYFQRGVAKHLLQSYADAIDEFQAAIQRTTRQDVRYICLYNQACGLARLGRKDEAIDKLEQSDEAGFRDLLHQMSIDPDLDSLRDLPRFKDFSMILRTR